jgi:hypothetical protein
MRRTTWWLLLGLASSPFFISAQAPGLELNQVVVEASAPAAPDDPAWGRGGTRGPCDPASATRAFRYETIQTGLPVLRRTGVSVSDFIGGKVSRVRVTHYRGRWDAPLEIQERIRSVWAREIDIAACYSVWAEPEFWNLQAIVEFDDGKTSSLLTDGTHVRVEDHAGTTWFIRLDPVP